MKNDDMNFSEATQLLYEGNKVEGCSLAPESTPIFLTTAFTMGNLEDVQNIYDQKGYTYVRTRNPNRHSLAEAISYLEKGKYTLIFSSGQPCRNKVWRAKSPVQTIQAALSKSCRYRAAHTGLRKGRLS